MNDKQKNKKILCCNAGVAQLTNDYRLDKSELPQQIIDDFIAGAEGLIKQLKAVLGQEILVKYSGEFPYTYDDVVYLSSAVQDAMGRKTGSDIQFSDDVDTAPATLLDEMVYRFIAGADAYEDYEF